MASGALQIRINPYPTRWRLPGDKTPSRQHLPSIEGIARRCIAHALTYHEIPPNVDAKIEALPAEEKLEELNPLQQDYLSFTVYSLKQMVAAGTISAETAWALFFGEWDRIDKVEKGTFAGMRQAFMRNIEKTDLTRDMDLLQFEFYARAGEAGLAQFERYNKWAEELIFDEETCKNMSDVIKDEYKKALWLEMRTIEEQVGRRDLNEDVDKFYLKANWGSFNDREISLMINIFNGTIGELSDYWKTFIRRRTGFCIDTIIKAEIGHWMFPFSQVRYKWVSELMDIMNASGLTNRIDDAFRLVYKENIEVEGLPPEARVFLQGGDFRLRDSDDSEAKYPRYPEAPSSEFIEDYEKIYGAALRVDRLIRERIIKAFRQNEINSRDVYKTYRKFGLYIALQILEEKQRDWQKSKDEIIAKINNFNLKEMEEYCNMRKSKIIKLLEETFNEKGLSFSGRAGAARCLMKYKNPEKDSAEYNRLYVYKLIAASEWDKVVGFGEIALPALEVILNDRDNHMRGMAAMKLIKIKNLEKDSDEYRRLYAYQLISYEEWEEVIKFGAAAVPALETALKDEKPRVSQKAAEVLEKIRISISVD